MVGAAGFEPATPCAQGRCATRLRYAPTSNSFDSSLFSHGPSVLGFAFWAKTVPELYQNSPIHPACPNTPDSLAARFSFSSASRFICSFICEYFLNTFASPCRRSCVTHSSATPPALRRVAYVERRS